MPSFRDYLPITYKHQKREPLRTEEALGKGPAGLLAALVFFYLFIRRLSPQVY